MHSIAVSERGGRLGSDIRKTDRLDAIHVDLTFLHFVTTAHFHMRACPDADAARDLSMANATPEAVWAEFTPQDEQLPQWFRVVCRRWSGTRNLEVFDLNWRLQGNALIECLGYLA